MYVRVYIRYTLTNDGCMHAGVFANRQFYIMKF